MFIDLDDCLDDFWYQWDYEIDQLFTRHPDSISWIDGWVYYEDWDLQQRHRQRGCHGDVVWECSRVPKGLWEGMGLVIV